MFLAGRGVLPRAGAALGALLPRPREPVFRLRPRAARGRDQRRLRGLAVLRKANPQPGWYMLAWYLILIYYAINYHLA
jgi:hypothetical protein